MISPVFFSDTLARRWCATRTLDCCRLSQEIYSWKVRLFWKTVESCSRASIDCLYVDYWSILTDSNRIASRRN